MSLSKLAVRRLTKLADYMDALPPEARRHFDMTHWLGHGRKHTLEQHGFKSGQPIRSAESLLSCGTSACAAGWASTIPSFRRLGFRIEVDLDDPFGGKPVYCGLEENQALSRFFDIQRESVNELFGYDVKAHTPKQWAKHCRRFLRDNA